jgi:hypothetical protein
MFFDKEFSDKQYNETRTQIKRRLYGIVENQTFERMFSATRTAWTFRTRLPTRYDVCSYRY